MVIQTEGRRFYIVNISEKKSFKCHRRTGDASDGESSFWLVRTGQID